VSDVFVILLSRGGGK